MRNNGFVFSMDLMLAGMIAFAGILFILYFSSHSVNDSMNAFNESSLEKQGIYLADLMVKTSQGNGVAFFDEEKKRVEENLVVEEKLEGFGFKKGKYFVKSIRLMKENSPKEIALSDEEGKCIFIKRFVLLKESMQKAVLGVEFCEK